VSDEQVSSADGTVVAGPQRTRRAVGLVLLVVVAVFAALALHRNWTAVRDDLGRLSPVDYLLSSLAAAAGLGGLWASWWAVLGGLGAHLPGTASRTTYFAAQLGKYVPGSVWPAVLQARMGRRYGIAGSTMVASYALWMAVLCMVGALAGGLVLTGGRIELSPWIALGAVATGVVAIPALLHERGLPGLVARLAERTGRRFPPLQLGWGPARDVVALSALTWLLLGLHAWLLARPLGAGLDELPLVVGAFALAFVVGILAVPLPAGAGLREAVLVLTLGASVGRAGALTVALLSRLVLIVVEVLLASVTGVPEALRRTRADVGAAGRRRPA
jgi:uncharacterized membrane protein YbhN (UPF0104 family)